MITEQEKKLRFEYLFMTFYPKMKAFAYKLLKSEEDSEDITQDVFVKLWSAPELLESEAVGGHFLFTIVRNQVYNFLKHKSVEHSYEEYAQVSASKLADVDIHDELHAREVALIIQLSIDNMPEQRRKVFQMSRYEDLSSQEIADKLGLSVRTVDRHIYLALADLKKIILFFTFFL